MTRILAGALGLALVSLALSGCATDAPEQHIQPEPYGVPVAQGCPDPKDVPVKPKKLHEEVAVMPASDKDKVRVMSAKLADYGVYVDQADPLLQKCSSINPQASLDAAIKAGILPAGTKLGPPPQK